MTFDGRSKLVGIIRNGTNQAWEPWRDWRSHGIGLIKGCIQFQCFYRLSSRICQQPGTLKFVNLIPSHHTGISRFNTHHRFWVSCIIGWNQTWKEDPSTPCKEGRGIMLLLSPQSCRPHHFDWMARGHLSSMKLPLLEVVDRGATWCTLLLTMTRRYIYLPWPCSKSCVVQTPMAELSLVNLAAILEPDIKDTHISK